MDSIDPEAFRNDPVEIASLPKYEEVTFTGLSKKYLVKQIVAISISFLIFLAIALVAYFVFPEIFGTYFPFILGGIALFFSWNYFSSYRWFKKSGYALRDRDIIFKRGFLVERTTVVPFNRVQHVSTSRDVLDKLLGLSRLKIFTAGGSGSDISIPGLKPSIAADLKEAVSIRISGHE